MAKSFKFTNANGLKLLMQKPYIITKMSGMGAATVDAQFQKAAFQDGQTYLDTTLNNIELILEFALVADTEAELFALRDNIMQVYNPTIGEGTVLYTNDFQDREVKCVVTRPPMFIGGYQAETCKVQRGMVYLQAPTPFWLDTTVSGETLSFSIPAFKFDLVIPSTGLVFETEGTNRSTITNNGHVETPVQITFNGPAVNPVINNETTGEFIKINKTLLEGQYLYIDTTFGNLTVDFFDGTEITNGYGFYDLDSTMWQLQVGDNEISYTADTGIETANVNVQYTQRYLGV